MVKHIPEIEFASAWWADQLRAKPKFDNGELLHAALFSAIPWSELPEEKITAFRELLRDEMLAKFYKNWDSKYPARGSALRTIGVDYGPEPILWYSCVKVGIDPINRFPVKTTMWINPGQVKVSLGYKAPPEVVFTCKSSQACEIGFL